MKEVTDCKHLDFIQQQRPRELIKLVRSTTKTKFWQTKLVRQDGLGQGQDREYNNDNSQLCKMLCMTFASAKKLAIIMFRQCAEHFIWDISMD